MYPNNSKLIRYYKSFINKLHFKIKKHKQLYFDSLFKKCIDNSKNKWNIINEIIGQNKKSV